MFRFVVADGSGLLLPFAVRICQGKVEGFLRFGRWLLAVGWDVESSLDAAYQRWARVLLGSPPRRAGFIALVGLGWTLYAFARALGVLICGNCRKLLVW